eukprot:7090689-Pyramimonas_sp.AAC.2
MVCKTSNITPPLQGLPAPMVARRPSCPNFIYCPNSNPCPTTHQYTLQVPCVRCAAIGCGTHGEVG